MFIVRPLKARLSFRIALTGMLLLLSLAGPAPGLAHAAPVLGAGMDAGGGPDTFRVLSSEPAGPEDVAPSPGAGTTHVPTIEMGIADTGLAAELGVLEDPVTPTLQFSASGYTVQEDDGDALAMVTLTPTSVVPVTVTYATIPGTATPDSDYTSKTGTLTFAPGDGFKFITVSIVGNELYELDETFILSLSDPANADLGAPVTTTVTIQDDDPKPVVSFETGSYSVNEATSPVLVTATLSAVSGVTATVTLGRTGGTATAVEDYGAETWKVTFAPGQVTQALAVKIVDDVLDENDETLNLTLSAPSNATVGAPSAATLTIIDDDDPPTIGFGSSSYIVDEGAGLATITVTLSAPSSRVIHVDYVTSDGTATAGSDYTARDDTLTFDPAAVIVDADLVKTVATSAYDPPSPDPAGVAYMADQNRLVISDSEVDEMGIYDGANVFVTELSGNLDYTFTTRLPLGFSDEPTGVAYRPDGDHSLFFSDDVRDRVFQLKRGAGGLYDPTDGNSVTEFRTISFGSDDAEGLTYDTWRGYVFLSDGDGEEIYEISPGVDGLFRGVYHPVYCSDPQTCDDQVTHFDTDRLGVHNPEGVEFDPHTGHLYILGRPHDPIAETTTDGKLIRYIDISVLNALNPGGLAYAPSSTDPSQWSLYIVERGLDNGPYPDENDGQVYEISFPPGETTRTFTVPILDDVVSEGNETVNLTLSNADHATLDPLKSTAVLTITDGFSSVQFSAPSYDADEGDGTATITATLDTPSSLTVHVDYAVTGGSATAGEDYTLASGTLTFDPDVVNQAFSVTIIDDDTHEASEETVELALSNPSNADLGERTAAVLHIQDNDPQPTVGFASTSPAQNEDGGDEIIGVELSRPSVDVVTVHYATSDGTATAGDDYVGASGILTFTPDTTIQYFPVSVLEDTLDESNETVILTLSSPSNAVLGEPTTTLTIYDNDDPPTVQFDGSSYSVGEGDGTATITVTLSAPSGQPVGVQCATSDGTATAGSDYASLDELLTFAPGETLKTCTVTILDDSADESSETVLLTLSGPSSAALGTPSDATLTIADNEGQPTVEFGGLSYNAAEGSGQASITVRLSHASASTVSVSYATSDDTALAGTDYQAASGTLTFDPGVTEQSFPVTIIDDLLDEEDETLGLALSSPSNATLGTPSSATLTIADDDDPPVVQFSQGSYSVLESAGSVTITVMLTASSGKAITVDYATSDGTAVAGSDYDTATGTLSFAPGETVKTFTVAIISDQVDEENETLGLALSNPSNVNLDGSSATLTILEDLFRVYLPEVYRNH